MKNLRSDGTGDFLSVRLVATMLGCTPRTIWKLCATGRFPPPIYLTPRLPRWRRSDVEDHMTALSRVHEVRKAGLRLPTDTISQPALEDIAATTDAKKEAQS
jgi:predicted DNA-binding transcriptional regulator AlpA